MFGKNYDKEIEDLYRKINEIVKAQNKNQEELLQMVKAQNKNIKELLQGVKDNQEMISNFENTLIEMAKVQKTHKEAIMLLSKR